jgi:hypothetical protein
MSCLKGKRISAIWVAIRRWTAGAQGVSLPIDSDTATELANRSTAALRSGDFSNIPVELNPEIHRILIHDGKQQYATLLRMAATTK